MINYGNLDQKPQQKPPTNKKYDYLENSNGTIDCFVGNKSKCIVDPIVKAKVLSTFHDERLADATDKINSILEETKEGNQDKSKCLSILLTPKGLFLAWTGRGITSSDEDEDELCRQLGID